MRLIDADALLPMVKYATTDSEIGVFPIKIGFNAIAKVIEDAPTVDAIPIQYILTTIREWNRDGYAESAEALEILVMDWDKENSECVERKEHDTD